MLTHNITKSSIDTKMAQWINSYFINGASQKHSNYIFENKSSFLLLKVVSELKFGHFYFSWPPLTSVTSEVGWKTSNFIVDFDVGKSKDFGVKWGPKTPLHSSTYLGHATLSACVSKRNFCSTKDYILGTLVQITNEWWDNNGFNTFWHRAFFTYTFFMFNAWSM